MKKQSERLGGASVEEAKDEHLGILLHKAEEEMQT
jgi:hypothetical protein